MKKRLCAIAVTLLFVFSCSLSSVLGADSQSVQVSSALIESAKNTAASCIPSGSILLQTITENNTFTFKFFNPLSQEKSIVVIKPDTNKVMKVKTQLNKEVPYETEKAAISIEKAQNLVKAELLNVEIIRTELQTTADSSKYFIQFRSPYQGRYIIEAKTGVILGREITIDSPYEFKSFQDSISWYQLDDIAHKSVPGGMITDFDYELKNGDFVFTVEVYRKGVLYHLIINPSNGELISKSANEDVWDYLNYKVNWEYTPYTPFIVLPATNGSNLKDASEIVSIALKKAPQASLVKLQMNYDYNKVTYLGMLADKSLEYEFEIDAASGKILSWKAYE